MVLSWRDAMPMTPTQLRATLRRLELNQVAASQRLGVDARTVRRWLAGDRRIPEPVAILLRTWLRDTRAPGKT